MTDRPIGEHELNAFVDGQLPRQRHDEVAAWLADHPDEAERVHADAAQRDALRQAFAPIMEEPIPARLDLRTMGHPARARWWQRPAMGPVMAIAASVALMLASGAAGWQLRNWTLPPRHGLGALSQEAAVGYSVYASDSQRPVEVAATEQTRFDQWATARLGRKVQAPDLAPSGFSLIGGRMIATPHGPAAMFLYDGPRGLRVALVARPMEIDKSASMRPFSAGTVDGYSWSREGMGFSVVGPAGGPDLHTIADTARREIGVS